MTQVSIILSQSYGVTISEDITTLTRLKKDPRILRIKWAIPRGSPDLPSGLRTQGFGTWPHFPKRSSLSSSLSWSSRNFIFRSTKNDGKLPKYRTFWTFYGRPERLFHRWHQGVPQVPSWRPEKSRIESNKFDFYPYFSHGYLQFLKCEFRISSSECREIYITSESRENTFLRPGTFRFGVNLWG